MSKDRLQLDGVWEFKEFPETARRMRDLDTGGWMAAPVPSSIYTCLIDAGLIDPAALTARPETFAWVSQRSWIFRTAFDADAALINQAQVRLVFEGLDTVAHLWLNGKLLGKVENMFTPHVFDVTGRLTPSGNTIHVKLLPALQRGEQLMQRYGRLSDHPFGDPRRAYLRKAQYQFGSVLGPALIGCGIIGSVRLEGAGCGRLDDLHVRTVDCDEHQADIRVAVTLERPPQTQTALTCRLHLTGGGLDRTETLHFAPQQDRHAMLLRIERPILWWPRGYGVPHQYHLKAELFHGDDCLDTAETDFGIRTISLNRQADANGHAFEFQVNGRAIYIQGANWVPLSLQPARTGPDRYARLLHQAVAAHLNMLRVWGGGMYEQSEFYRQCDRLGILVWQDFMFAAGYYPDRPWFAALVAAEARSVIRRLRNHPCLALWCGNSRIDSLHKAGRLGPGRKFFGKALYHELLPGILSELDPDREYIATTPFSESPDADANDPVSGTTHCWQFGQPVAPADGEAIPRFVAEFGLQSLPAEETVARFGDAGAAATGALILEHHHYQPDGPARMARTMAAHFTPAENRTQYIRHSQLAQARAAKQFVEQLRSNRPVNAGALLWTFNDPAACVGFSAIDAAGIPKALYYYAQRFFAPILVALTRSRVGEAATVRVVNDSPQRITATLTCRMMRLDGPVLDQIQMPVALGPMTLSNRYPLPKSFPRPQDAATAFLHLSLDSDTAPLAENVYCFAPDKHLRLGGAVIDVEIGPPTGAARSIRLCSETLVPDVQVRAPGRVSDNFITLLPNRPVTLTLTSETPLSGAWVPMELVTGSGIGL